MEEWREIRGDIKEALDVCEPACKVMYFKPKNGECSYFKVVVEDLCMMQSEIESMLEEVMEHHVLEPEWDSDEVLNLRALWDEEEL